MTKGDLGRSVRESASQPAHHQQQFGSAGWIANKYVRIKPQEIESAMDSRWHHAKTYFGSQKMYGVGIDVSKQKSTVAIFQPGEKLIRKPFDVKHTNKDIDELARYIKSLDGEVKVVMECTGRYHEPIRNTLSNAGIFVSAVNAKLIKKAGNNSLRRVKSDPADSKKIAKYVLDNWAHLRQYSSMDKTREQLKVLNGQMEFFTNQKVAVKNNLIALLDMTYPGVNKLFDSPVREDGSEKWVDFAATFWHVDCVRKLGIKEFSRRYEAFCRKHGYNFRQEKASIIFESSKELVPVYSKDQVTKKMVQRLIQQLNVASANVEQVRKEMNDLASTLPEYNVVLGMDGVGKTFGPQLIAEIGEITRYEKRESLTAYAGVDPGVNESGDFVSKSNHSSKCGPSRLRKTLYLVMSSLIENKPEDRVYQFLDKKRSEGKPYNVYMTAGANKFLRIYYGKVKELYRNLGLEDQKQHQSDSPVVTGEIDNSVIMS